MESQAICLKRSRDHKQRQIACELTTSASAARAGAAAGTCNHKQSVGKDPLNHKLRRRLRVLTLTMKAAPGSTPCGTCTAITAPAGVVIWIGVPGVQPDGQTTCICCSAIGGSCRTGGRRQRSCQKENTDGGFARPATPRLAAAHLLALATAALRRNGPADLA